MIRNHGKKSRNTVPLIYDIFPELGSLDLTRPNSSQASTDDLCPLNAPHEVYYFFLKQKTYFLKQKVLPKRGTIPRRVMLLYGVSTGKT